MEVDAAAKGALKSKVLAGAAGIGGNTGVEPLVLVLRSSTAGEGKLGFAGRPIGLIGRAATTLSLGRSLPPPLEAPRLSPLPLPLPLPLSPPEPLALSEPPLPPRPLSPPLAPRPRLPRELMFALLSRALSSCSRSRISISRYLSSTSNVEEILPVSASSSSLSS